MDNEPWNAKFDMVHTAGNHKQLRKSEPERPRIFHKMKVLDNLLFSIFQYQDERLRRELARRTVEISTGKRIHNVSDDPVATFNVLNLKKDIAELSQFSRNRLFADVNLSGFFGGVQGPDRRIELCAGLLPGWGRLFLERL